MAKLKKQPKKEKSNSIKLLRSKALEDAKVIVVRRKYDSIGEYATQALEEKNKREGNGD
jgi:hypothetical protein